jgi:copper(I)-binding protein
VRKAALIVALLLGAGAAAAAPGGVQATRLWSRPAAAGTNGVGYLTLVNRGKADALVGVETSVAAKVEMHASSMAGGVMRMSAEDRVPLPPGAEVRFAPGGRHLMLLNLKRALRPGDRIPATLRLASGRMLKVTFAVGEGAEPGAAMDGMRGMH